MNFLYCFWVQIYHTDGKYGPLALGALLANWSTSRVEAAVVSDVNVQGSSSVLSLISEISDEVCSQLHSGIMRTARKTLLDEIVSCVISESITTKKNQKAIKVEPAVKSVKSSSSSVVSYY